jgi:hypothetical protein
MTQNVTNSELWLSANAMRVPENQRIQSLTVWGDAAIWGLEFHADQTPWFTLIECLQLLTYRSMTSGILFPGPEGNFDKPLHEKQSYRIMLNTNLRHLLFRDHEAARIGERDGANDSVKWQRWIEAVKKVSPSLDFSYVEAAFSGDFHQFAESVELLKSAEVEPFRNQRWTSRHLQPVGKAMLFPDVKTSADGNFSLDRRFFRRTGEVLYLMLNRATRRSELTEHVAKRVLGTDSPWNSIARRLQGPEADAAEDQPKWVDAQTIGYLPVRTLPRYDELADDWISILQQGSIPIEDALEFLMRLSGLHQVIYIAERAAHVAGRNGLLPFVLDMSGSARNNPMQVLASERYKAHKALLPSALDKFISSYSTMAEWSSLGKTADLLAKRFSWTPKKSSNPGTHAEPKDQLQSMLNAAKTRRHDIGSTFTSHARKIGLLSARQGAGTWYSPSDGLLEALVLANVRSAMDLGQFLDVLKRRYGLVIGPEEARTGSGDIPVPLESLRENERRLEERLRVLGFINRKSDDCAFVVNPFAAGRVHAGSYTHAIA